MNNTIFIINNSDGSCSIIHPAPEMFDINSGTRKLLENTGVFFANDEEVMNWIVKKDISKGLKYKRSTLDMLPNNRYFRNAWIYDEKNHINIDKSKAIEVRKNDLRNTRGPLLQNLDIAYMKAAESNDNVAVASIIAKKQALRDFTKLQFPEDLDLLKNFTPDCFNIGA